MAKKYFFGKFLKCWRKKFFFLQTQNFPKSRFGFSKNLHGENNLWVFFETFFSISKKNIFSELEFFFEYSFDAEIHDLSIYEGPRVILELFSALIDRNVAGCRNTKSKTWKSPGRAGGSSAVLATKNIFATAFWPHVWVDKNILSTWSFFKSIGMM